MKLSDIEPVARMADAEKVAIFTNEVRKAGEPLYVADQTVEYAKAKVREALEKYAFFEECSLVRKSKIDQAVLEVFKGDLE